MVTLVEIEKRFADQRQTLQPLMRDFEAAITQLTAIRQIVFESRLSKRYGAEKSPIVTPEMERSIKDEISPIQGLTADEMKEKMVELQDRLNRDADKATRDRDDARIKIIKGGVRIVVAAQEVFAGDVVKGTLGIISELPDIKKEWHVALKEIRLDGVELAEFADKAWTQYAALRANKLLDEVQKMGWKESDNAFLHYRHVNSDGWKAQENAFPYDAVRYRMASRMELAADKSLRELNSGIDALPQGLRAAIGNGVAQRGSQLVKQGYSAGDLAAAVQIASRRRSVTGRFSISKMFVEEAVVIGPQAVSDGVSRAQDMINTSYLERNINQVMDRYVKRRTQGAEFGEPVMLLFNFDQFRESVLRVVEPTAVSVGVNAGEKKSVNLSDIDDELDICSRILLQASISSAASDDPKYKAACRSEMETVAGLRQRIGKEPADRKVQIAAGREASAGTFNQLDGEIRAELSKAKMLNAFGARIGEKAASTSVSPGSPSPVDPVNERKMT